MSETGGRDHVTTSGGDADEILSEKHRWGVVVALQQADESLPVNAVRLRGAADEVVDEYRQIHLPILEEHGYIEWDRESGEISKGPNFDEIKQSIESGSFK